MHCNTYMKITQTNNSNKFDTLHCQIEAMFTAGRIKFLIMGLYILAFKQVMKLILNAVVSF